jgi:RIP metalloprotease RseP
VKIAGMNPFENDVPEGDEHRAYSAKPIWQRIVVILAGPLSHFVVAWLIFAGVFFFSANWSIPGVVGVDPTLVVSPAHGTSGFLPGDRITMIGDLANPSDQQIVDYEAQHIGKPVTYVVARDGQRVHLTLVPHASPAAVGGMLPGDVIERIGTLDEPTSADIGAYQHAHVDQPIDYVVLRDGQLVTLTIIPTVVPEDQSVRIGIELAGVKEGPIASLEHAGGAVWDTTREAVVGLGTVFGPRGVHDTVTALFSNSARPTDGGVSLIGVSREAGHAGSQGAWAYFFTIFATVVLFIGLVNLLPFPPLDGGHVAIAVLEKIQGHRIDMKKVVPVSAAVLLILGFFSISAIILDIWKPIQRP